MALKKRTKKIKIKIPDVLGLPPAGYTNKDIIELTMPTAKLHPCEPDFTKGMTLYTLKKEYNAYSKLLEEHEYTCDLPLKVAFLADNFPTDTFTNSYGESFLQKTTDVVSEAVGEATQIMGAKTATEAVQKAAEKLKASESSILKGIGAGITGAHATAKDIFKAIPLSGGTKQTMDALLARGRIDFPQVWKNSAFAPSYTMTVRLYNPRPADQISTKKYIIGPIAALMLLGLPRATAENVYSWPFFVQVESPGIYNLNPGYINNITVVKGGDQQSIAWNQRMGIVDVRLDFGSLYNSVIATGDEYSKAGRPTLKNYLAALKTERPVTKGAFYKVEDESVIEDTVAVELEKNLSAGNSNVVEINAGDTPDSRVSAEDSNKTAQLVTTISD
jgi:hypothetical protein